MAPSILQREEPTFSRPESRSDATEQERKILEGKGESRKNERL
jgi:hypothetical protein